MSLCILHANCQGAPLRRLLLASAEFAKRWNILHITSYDRTPVPADALEHCDLFLYQHLGPQWGDLASENLIARLPGKAKHIRLPALFCMNYWPLWTSNSPMHFGDVYLDYLIDKGLSAAEVARVYLHGKLDAAYDLEARIQSSKQHQQTKDEGVIISLESYIDDHWREEQLFTTINHPAPKLSLMVANAVLADLGLPPLDSALLDQEGDALDCDRQVHLPIHPAVGRRFGLPFVREDRRYRVYDNMLTFRQYTLAYIDCRLKGLPFLVYLATLRV